MKKTYPKNLKKVIWFHFPMQEEHVKTPSDNKGTCCLKKPLCRQQIFMNVLEKASCC